MPGSLPYNYKILFEKRKKLLSPLQVELSTLPKSHADLINATEINTLDDQFAKMFNDFEGKAEDEKQDSSLKEKMYRCPTELRLKLNAYKEAVDAYQLSVDGVESVESRTSKRKIANAAAIEIEKAMRRACDLFDDVPEFDSLLLHVKSFEEKVAACHHVNSTKNFSDFLENEKKLINMLSPAIIDSVNSVKTLEKTFDEFEDERGALGKIFIPLTARDATLVAEEKQTQTQEDDRRYDVVLIDYLAQHYSITSTVNEYVNDMQKKNELSRIAKSQEIVRIGTEALAELKKGIDNVVAKSKEQIVKRNKEFQDGKESLIKYADDMVRQVNEPNKHSSLLESKDASKYKLLIDEIAEARNSLLSAVDEIKQWLKIPVVIEEKEIPLDPIIRAQYPEEVEVIHQIWVCIKQHESYKPLLAHYDLLAKQITCWLTANQNLVEAARQILLPAVVKLFEDFSAELNAPQRLHQPANRKVNEKDKKNNPSNPTTRCCLLQ